MTTSKPHPTTASSEDSAAGRELERRKLVVVTGKGGVGKSALAAVLGRSLARRGRRALLLEIDPRENLHQLLDLPPSGGEIAAAGERLYLQNLKPLQVVDWVVERQVKIGPLVKRLRSSPIYRRFVEGTPGLKEMAILGHALRLVRGELRRAPAVDVVVLDAPATGHGLYLLTAPRLFAQAIGDGPVAELAGEVADFVADPEACGVVVVTLAEEMPVDEALELGRALDERFGRRPELLAVNALYPRLPEEPAREDALIELWRRRRQLNEEQLARLESAWQGPRVELPLLAMDRGPRLVDQLLEDFDRALARSGETAWT